MFSFNFFSPSSPPPSSNKSGEEDDLIKFAEQIKQGAVSIMPKILKNSNLSVDLLKTLIKEKIRIENIDSVDSQGRSFIHFTAEHGDAEWTRFFISQSINKQIQDNNGRTALHVAAMSERGSVNIEMLESSIEIKDKDGKTAVHLAAIFNQLQSLKEFDPQFLRMRDTDGRTPLFYAAFNGYVEIVQYLLDPESDESGDESSDDSSDDDSENGSGEPPSLTSNPNSEENGSTAQDTDIFGRYPIHAAVHAPIFSLEMIDHLLSSGADLNAVDSSGNSALHWAILVNAKNGFEVVDGLLSRGIDLNLQNRSGKTALHLAAISNQKMIIYGLLRRSNLDPNLQDNKGRTALHYALRFPDLFSLMAKNDRIELYLAEFQGQQRTPLHDLILSLPEATLLELFKQINFTNLRSEKINSTLDNQKRSLLHYSVARKFFKLSSALLGIGIDVHIHDYKGRTAMHYAACFDDSVDFFLAIFKHVESRDLFFKLMTEKSFPKAAFSVGVSPWDIIVHRKDKELMDKISSLNLCDDEGTTLVHLALRAGDFSLALMLKGDGNYCSSTIKQNRPCLTPLMISTCFISTIDQFSQLVDSESDIYHVDSHQHNILHFAAIFGNITLVDHLISQLKMSPLVRDAMGRTPLYFAAAFGHVETVLFLISKRNFGSAADHITHKTLDSPLLIAINHHNLQNGSSLKLVDILSPLFGLTHVNKFNRGLLFYAVLVQDCELVRQLLKEKELQQQIFLEDCENQSPHSLSIQLRIWELVEIISEAISVFQRSLTRAIRTVVDQSTEMVRLIEQKDQQLEEIEKTKDEESHRVCDQIASCLGVNYKRTESDHPSIHEKLGSLIQDVRFVKQHYTHCLYLSVKSSSSELSNINIRVSSSFLDQPLYDIPDMLHEKIEKKIAKKKKSFSRAHPPPEHAAPLPPSPIKKSTFSSFFGSKKNTKSHHLASSASTPVLPSSSSSSSSPSTPSASSKSKDKKKS